MTGENDDLVALLEGELDHGSAKTGGRAGHCMRECQRTENAAEA